MTQTATPPSTATPERKNPLANLDWRRYVIYIGFAVVFLFFAITLGDDGFLTGNNLLNIVRQTATVTIITDSADNAVLVPNAAISNGNVTILRNGSTVSVPVQTGISDGVNTQIISGLLPGDQVVTGVISSSKSSSGSSGSSIFGFGGPGGGSANNRSAAPTAQRGG